MLRPMAKGMGASLALQTQFRRLALKNFRPLGYPTIEFIDRSLDPAMASVLATQAITKYAGFVVLDVFEPAARIPAPGPAREHLHGSAAAHPGATRPLRDQRSNAERSAPGDDELQHHVLQRRQRGRGFRASRVAARHRRRGDERADGLGGRQVRCGVDRQSRQGVRGRQTGSIDGRSCFLGTSLSCRASSKKSCPTGT